MGFNLRTCTQWESNLKSLTFQVSIISLGYQDTYAELHSPFEGENMTLCISSS